MILCGMNDYLDDGSYTTDPKPCQGSHDSLRSHERPHRRIGVRTYCEATMPAVSPSRCVYCRLKASSKSAVLYIVQYSPPPAKV